MASSVMLLLAWPGNGEEINFSLLIFGEHRSIAEKIGQARRVLVEEGRDIRVPIASSSTCR